VNTNFAIVIGLKGPEAEPEGIYCGRDWDKAYALLENPPEGFEWVFLYRNPIPTRRRQTDESVLLERKRQEDTEKRLEEQRSVAEAKAKAEAEAKAAEEKARIALIQATQAAEQKSAHAKRLQEEAETLERIAREARAGCDQANAALGAGAPGSSPSSQSSPVGEGGVTGDGSPESTTAAPGSGPVPDGTEFLGEAIRLGEIARVAREAADAARAEAAAKPRDKRLAAKADELELAAAEAVKALENLKG
jgi:colicin import membrane protein